MAASVDMHANDGRVLPSAPSLCTSLSLHSSFPIEALHNPDYGEQRIHPAQKFLHIYISVVLHSKIPKI